MPHLVAPEWAGREIRDALRRALEGVGDLSCFIVHRSPVSGMYRHGKPVGVYLADVLSAVSQR